MDFRQELWMYQIKYQISTLKPIMSADAINAIKYLSKEYGFDANEKMRLMIEDGTIKAPKEKKEKKPKEKKEKKEKKPKEKKKSTSKRGISGYNLHNKIERPSVKDELEKLAKESGEKFKSTAIMSALAARWKALSDDDKTVWNDKAKLENESSSEDDEEVKEEVNEEEVKEEVKEEEEEEEEEQIDEDEY